MNLQGHKPAGPATLQPKKKPRNLALRPYKKAIIRVVIGLKERP